MAHVVKLEPWSPERPSPLLLSIKPNRGARRAPRRGGCPPRCTRRSLALPRLGTAGRKMANGKKNILNRTRHTLGRLGGALSVLCCPVTLPPLSLKALSQFSPSLSLIQAAVVGGWFQSCVRVHYNSNSSPGLVTQTV
eukprot:scaffold10552_cov111-Isochrysis_galbana.AAC.1